MPTYTIRLTIEYDGTEFSGFQTQVGQRTVQSVLETAIGAVTGESIRVDGAGRTDAGVHAVGQVVSFKTTAAHAPDRWCLALNAKLPADIAVRDSRQMDGSFHARFSARGREYVYTIWNAPSRPAVNRAYVYHWRAPLDVAAMSEALGSLVGTHDFAAYSASLKGKERMASTVREVYRARCWRDEPRVCLSIAANAFLPHMVRNIVGTSLDVGNGKLPTRAVREILETRDRRQAGRTAPARGLCLMRVWYDDAELEWN